MTGLNRIDTSIHCAALTAAALIAHQVGGKATRDALFLSHFDVTGLAWIVIAGSVLSILIGFAGARIMTSIAPGRLVPRAFLVSGLLLLVEWAISSVSPKTAAILVFLQIAALGSALISGFWTLLGDRFDPHTARKQYTRIVAAATFGGMVGGLIAERIGTVFSVTAMLPVLAGLDFICALLTLDLGRAAQNVAPARKSSKRAAAGPVAAFRLLWDEPYLRNLASLIVVTTAGAGLLDYVFKANAVAAHASAAEMVRFFAIFYAVIGVVTFLVQIVLSRFSLEKLGLAGTIGSLPFALAAGSVAGIALPGIGSAGVARASESILRSSLFRSGYELFYAAVPSRKRRETKPVVDIGFERIGDMIGGMLIGVFLLLGTAAAIPLMLVLAGASGLIGLWTSRKLHHGYIKALETNLLNQSIHIEISDIRDSTTRRAVLRTLTGRSPARETRHQPVAAVYDRRSTSQPLDPVVQRIVDLRSTEADVVRHALRDPLDPSLAAHVIPLLAWNAVADDALEALQKIAPSITGMFVDVLLDPAQEFTIRRRIPRILSMTDSKRAFDGLTQALFDNRFEVRFQSGRGLAQIQDRVPDIRLDQELIMEAVLQELVVDKEVWESRRVIDAGGDEPMSVSSEHVFRLLSLILPRDPMRIAFRGLHSGNEHLKGMALEYLESVLPAEVRKTIRPLLETA